jgi:hypothetical protein
MSGLTGPDSPTGPVPRTPRRGGRAAARAEARRRRKRRNRQALAASAAVVLLAAGGGYVAMAGGDGDEGGGGEAAKPPASQPVPGGDDQSSAPEPLSTASFMVDSTAAKPLGRSGRWSVVTTKSGGEVPDRSFTCQTQRFADPGGVRTWYRALRNQQANSSAVQYVELSGDSPGAQKAFQTISTWLSNCETAQQRLVSSYTSKGLGERGLVAVFGQPVNAEQARYRAITLAGSGPVTMVLEHVSVGTSAPSPTTVLAAAAGALRKICSETESSCGASPQLTPQLLPANEQPRGFMSPIDLPVMQRIKQPWVGVEPAGVLGTQCEKLDRKKAKRVKGRTYVIPNSGAPAEIGIDTMVLEFASPTQAEAMLATNRTAMEKCSDTQLNARVRKTLPAVSGGIKGQTWVAQYEQGEGKKPIVYRIGMVRASYRLAYVAFYVLDGYNITDKAFADVVARAGERSLYYR